MFRLGPVHMRGSEGPLHRNFHPAIYARPEGPTGMKVLSATQVHANEIRT